MSKIALKPNESGTGVFTLAAPDSNADRTLNLPDASGSIVAADASTGRFESSNMPAGSVIQVVQAVKADKFTSTSTSFTVIPGLEASITPTASSSKIMVFGQLAYGLGANSRSGTYKITRGGVDIYIGDAAGSRTRAVFGGRTDSTNENDLITGTIMVLDSPNTTSEITYQFEGITTNSSQPFSVNASQEDVDNNIRVRGASSITVMEVAG